MLGKVYRSGIGWQITYAGHPLYLFDQGPYEVTGEGWDEPGLPPWHGVWDLIQPSGKALAWPGTLTVLDLHGQWVLATPMFTAVGWEDFPLYTYSKDSGSASACSGACAIAWPRMLTSSMPAVDGALNPNWVGTLRTGQGWQVSYHGRPLYLFGNETIVLSPTGKFLATGSGQGITLNGGTFSLATP
jgi:predicted lipoprotein with Yx(FWY)xxD motif